VSETSRQARGTGAERLGQRQELDDARFAIDGVAIGGDGERGAGAHNRGARPEGGSPVRARQQRPSEQHHEPDAEPHVDRERGDSGEQERDQEGQAHEESIGKRQEVCHPTSGHAPRTLLLARYTDPHGRPHRVVLRGRLLIDLAPRQQPRLVAQLSEAEGEPEARALLDGSPIDEGYLARARREPRAFIRPLRADDLRPPGAEPERSAELADYEAADEPPLAA
jgi:hypothetical protein